ncbi:hypothetical protein [Flavobacterium sp.]|jgi:hypothetical protein|uniref:hypothetical protein n=1 Tax=Flavobacterium sp. TaxID=239 RepID=UPI0037C0AA03
MDDDIPDLMIERIEDGHGEGLIRLTQYDNGEHRCIVMHPLHLRYMAEKFGLVPTADPVAAKRIAAGSRRLLVLRERVDHVAELLKDGAGDGLPARAYAQAYSAATAAIAAEFCADLDEEPRRPCLRPCAGGSDGEQQALTF